MRADVTLRCQDGLDTLPGVALAVAGPPRYNHPPEVALSRLPVGDPRRALVAGRADWLD